VDILAMLEQAYSEMIDVAAKVTPDDMERATPCSNWDVRALANHFLWTSAVLSEATTGKPGPDASVLAPGMGANSGLVGDDVAGAVPRRLEESLALWHQPGSLEATCDLPIGQIPGLFAAHFNLLDIYVHRWDLARAIGHDPTMNHELAEAALTFAQGVVTDDLRAQVDIAAPVVLAPGASPGDQLVAFMGRHP
jgi:uncharacterized protein (TIGR03086 family)